MSNISDDPFVNGTTTPPTNGSGRGQHRYSSFDTKLFSQYSSRESPTLPKRTLHDGGYTDQMNGTSDRAPLGDRTTANGEVGPELRQRLADLEQDYDDIGRETARYSPRKVSHDVGDQASEGAMLAGETRMSPTKPQAASRRQRNAPSGRVHDIEFATEISTSLLAQLRQLQGVLAEKEDALKQAHDQNARLQQTSERFDHRLRELDDTEQRYKEQTWQLESQVQDLAHQMKDAAMREQRLTQHLNAAKTGRSTIEREYDELRQSHEQLSDDHGHLYKQHETEVTGMQRALASGDDERMMLNQKIEELMIHNEHLKREMEERLRAAEARESDMNNGDIIGMDRPITPEGMGSHSPVKATPRVGALEAETLKSSLNHAHRMIQNMKNNIHREKTEKQELKRMLQDARDELEARRADVGGVNPGAIKRRKPQQDNQRSSRPDMLGAAGAPREEIINDPLWEEYEDSPTRPRAARRGDQYDLTTDASDAFETANEEGTDTEGFRTADDLARESDGDQTETEGSQQKRSRFAAMHMKRQTSSFESTASDDDGLDDYDLTTPPANQTGYRAQLDRIGNLSGGSHDSPASFLSRSSQPRQNLAAELDDLDDSSVTEGTPVTRGTTSRGASPNTEGVATPIPMRKASIVRTTSRPTPAPMVHSGMMTEPWQPPEPAIGQGDRAATDVLAASGPAAALAGAGAAMAADGSTNLQIPGNDLAKRRSFDPSMAPPPLLPSPRSLSPNPQSPRNVSPPVNLTMSTISSQHIEPIAPVQDSIVPDRADTPKAHANNRLRVQTASAPADKDNVEPSPVSMNGFAEAISPIATPTEEPANSSISFVKGLISNRSIPVVASPPSPEEPRVRDFAMEQKPAFDGRDANKVLLEPHLRVARDTPQGERRLEEPTLQIATPLYEDPRKSTFALPYVNPTAAEKGKARAAVLSSTGTQTLVSGDQIENLLKERRKSFAATLPQVPNPAAKNGTNERTMSMGSVNGRPDAAAFLQNTTRPTSAGSARGIAFPSPQSDLPPLPANHQEVIAAAARTSGLNSMMPPPMPPSAWRPPSASRNRAPSGTFSHSPSRQVSTPRHSSVAVRPDGTPMTRRSSVSSLQSELDERFGMTPRHYMGGEGFEIAPNTDPRMIQAITQTMIGEFLWKYTRKAGRSGEHSENRHKRFFWIHPYTRTLYWSNQDPAIPSQKELKAKSVAIEAVRVVSDENPIPAGLHTKSLVIVTPGRSIKFTAPTPQRHETWFNALSYLLLRKDPDEANAAVHGGSVNKLSDTLSSSNYTPDDIAEFNPAYSRSASRVTTGSRRSMGGSVPATPRSNMQSSSSLAARTASPQRSTPGQASLAARQSSATAAFGQVHPVQKFSQQAQPNYASMSSNTVNSIGPGYYGPSGPNMSQTTFESPTRAPPQYQQQQQPFDASTTSLARTATTEADNDGFKKPRPISTAPTVADSTRSERSTKIGSMSGGWRASLFGRGRSKSRGRSGAPDPVASTTSVGGNAGNGQTDGASDTMNVPPLPQGGWGGPAYVGGVENVRACCDGKHDVGSLDHHHHKLTKGRTGSSRSRSRPGSASSRYSERYTQNAHGASGSVSSRY